MVKDKDVSTVLSFLPIDASYYFCQSSNPRAMTARELQELAIKHGLQGLAIMDVTEALAQAKKESHTDDVLWVGGSLYVLGELALN